MTTTAKRTIEGSNKITALKFIEGFNNDDWDAVREVVADGFVFHHPVGGTVQAGPEGMVTTWAGFKGLSPDSWHPIPVMIAEGDYVAVLLPTYGTFTGAGEYAPPPTGGRLDYGMVNIVRLENGRLAEMWFGMDSLVEMQQMGVAPPLKAKELSKAAEENLAAFQATVSDPDRFDHVAAFDDAVVAMGPLQADKATTTRWIEVYQFDSGSPTLAYTHHMTTNPPYGGDSAVDTEASRALVQRWIESVINVHNPEAIPDMVSPHLLIHPTAMPCEATYYGATGGAAWLDEQWQAFADLKVVDYSTVARGDIVAVRWAVKATSTGSFVGFPPTQRAIDFDGVSMYRIEDDKIAEIWDTRDTLGILGQLNPDLAGHHHHHDPPISTAP